MRKFVLMAVIGLLAAPAWASLIFYDGFDYTAGNAAGGPYLAPKLSSSPGQHNVAYNVDWYYAGAATSGNPNNSPFINSGNLSVAGMPASTGNSVGFDTSQIGTARVQISPAALNSGTIYWSGYLKVDAVNSLTFVNGQLLGGFNNVPGYQNTSPGAVGACLRIKTDPGDSAKFLIGTAMNSGTGAGNIQFEASGSGHGMGDTVFVVAAYTFVAGSNNDVAQMWINPTPGGAQPAATLTSAPGGSVADSFASLSTFNLRNVNTVGTATAYFDELRVGDDWASVTPEPTSLTLLAGASLLISSRRRRH